jgi:hypothetical protein
MNDVSARIRPALWVTAALATAFAMAVTGTMLMRLTHPYDLEWMEGGVLAHAWRLQQGQGVYVEPSPTFIPMIYPPGYFAALAGLGAVFGLGHPVGRTISVLATLAVAMAFVAGARAWRGPNTPARDATWFGVVGAGLYLSTYERSGAFFDLVRPDSLHLALLAWSVVLTSSASSRGRDASALLLATSFAVKHNAAIYGFPLVLSVISRWGLPAGLRWAAIAAGTAGAFTAAMQVATGGLFLTWILEVPASHPSVSARFFPGAFRELGLAVAPLWAGLAAWGLHASGPWLSGVPLPVRTALPILAGSALAFVVHSADAVQGVPEGTALESAAVAFAVGALGVLALLGGLVWPARAVAGRSRPEGVLLLAGLGVVGFIVAGLMRAHHGGFLNVYMPFHAYTAAAFLAVGLAAWEARNTVAVLAFAMLATTQLGTQAYRAKLGGLVPDAADVAAGDAAVAWLRTQDGPILSPFAPWLAAQAGHAPGFHLIALWDIRHPEGPFATAFEPIQRAVETQAFGAVIEADEGSKLGTKNRYVEVMTFTEDPSAMRGKTGWRARPNHGYVPKPNSP